MTEEPNKRANKPFLFLGFFFIIWWLIPNSIKFFTKSTFQEFQAPVWEISSRVEDIVNYWGHIKDSKQTLIEKGKKVSRINSDIEIQKIRADELNNEINRLKKIQDSLLNLNKIINLDPKIQFEPEIARVSVRKMSSWWQSFTIRKGNDHLIEKGNGVLYKGGILGRVSTVNNKSASVELLTNPNFRIVAKFSNDSRPVTYQGNGIGLGGKLQGIVSDVPHDIIPKSGIPLKLISSSLGGNFPNGIPIGKVYKLETEENGLFKKGKVVLDSKINEILEITVLKTKRND